MSVLTSLVRSISCSAHHAQQLPVVSQAIQKVDFRRFHTVPCPLLSPFRYISGRCFSSRAPSTIQFPSENAIISYLKQHPLTKDQYFAERKIVETIAAVFADQARVPGDIDLGVRRIVYKEGLKLGLRDREIVIIGVNLRKALMGYAKGASIALEKSD